MQELVVLRPGVQGVGAAGAAWRLRVRARTAVERVRSRLAASGALEPRREPLGCNVCAGRVGAGGRRGDIWGLVAQNNKATRDKGWWVGARNP